MQLDKYPLLALDIGAGTTDMLLWSDDELPANCPRMIVPSATVIAARKITAAAARSKSIHLDGWLMGGGPSVWAIKNALKNGVRVSATKNAALTIKDNLDAVREMGVVVRETKPKGATTVTLMDIDVEAIRESLRPWGLDVPAKIAVAAQDHGFSPTESNRVFRIRHFQRILDKGGRLRDLHPPKPPAYMTRLKSITQQAKIALVMDTGPAAILGALEDPMVAKAAKSKGATLLNFGNAHTLAFLIKGDKLFGFYEHHTRNLDEKRARLFTEKLIAGKVTNAEIFDDNGHGAAYAPGFKPGGFGEIFSTGPRRAMAASFSTFAAPHGDMMLSGCFGLVKALKENSKKR